MKLVNDPLKNVLWRNFNFVVILNQHFYMTSSLSQIPYHSREEKQQFKTQ